MQSNVLSSFIGAQHANNLSMYANPHPNKQAGLNYNPLSGSNQEMP